VATLALGIAVGAEVVEAAYLANVAAGVAVGKPGTAVVTTGELIATLNQGAGGETKIFTLASTLDRIQAWRERGSKIAFTNGCFDLLHPGHIALLERARATADRLVVGLNGDLSVRRLKGAGRPIQSEIARATVLASLKCVDAVVIFPEDTPMNMIEAIAPDVLVKGADYTMSEVVGSDFVRSRGGQVILVELILGHSTTDTVKRVVGLGS